MFQFVPNTIPNRVFVIGAGGTGGRLVPLLAQFMRSITHGLTPTGWLTSPKIYLVDFDVVEPKNLLRQNFVKQDIDRHKAVVLAERYTRAYGVEIIPLLRKIEAKSLNAVIEDIKKASPGANIPDNPFNNSIVVMCVDSAQARRDILSMLCGTKADIFFIDAGNEDDFGQVNFFNNEFYITYGEEDVEQIKKEIESGPKLTPAVVNLSKLPLDWNHYNALEDNKSLPSCAGLDQTLAINAIMATTIMGVIQNYYYKKPFTYNGVSISLNGGNSTQYNTLRNIVSKSVEWSDSIAKYPTSATVDAVRRYLKANAQALKDMGLDNDGNPIKKEVVKVEEVKKPQPKKSAKKPPVENLTSGPLPEPLVVGDSVGIPESYVLDTTPAPDSVTIDTTQTVGVLPQVPPPQVMNINADTLVTAIREMASTVLNGSN